MEELRGASKGQLDAEEDTLIQVLLLKRRSLETLTRGSLDSKEDREH